ncbi:acetyl-CoA C-acyltransferase [Gammaproteobacteria bacterium]|nr:acetyl-CoA C-acyltransferase [Gammaproteobacteria bacterium]
MAEKAYIVSAVRTPGGKKNGSLSDWHPADMGAAVLDELVKQTGVDPKDIDDVIFGCVDQVGAQAGNLARNAVLASSLPESVPGTTIDRQCGSSQQALHFAAQAVMSGTQDIVIAGGVEVMSIVPIGASITDGMKAEHGFPFNAKGIEKRYPGIFFSQFTGAELVADKWNLSRSDLDSFALESHIKAANASKADLFKSEILPLEGNKGSMVISDEGIRYDASIEGLSGLNSVIEGGVITAGNASQITDGASAIMICNDEGLKKIKTNPRALIKTITVVGDDPVFMLTGPISASKLALKQSNLNIDEIDLYEVNEAFAPVPMAWAIELNADKNKLNVNGGAIALGHPLGATGTSILSSSFVNSATAQPCFCLISSACGVGVLNA